MFEKLSISDWIALIGVILTVFGFIYKIVSKNSSNKEKLTVKHSSGYFTYGRQLSENYYLFLECINFGSKTVTLESCYLELPNKKTLVNIENNLFGHNFPYELSQGKNFQYAFDIDSIENSLKGQGFRQNIFLKPVFTTQLGNKFYGKEIEIPLD